MCELGKPFNLPLRGWVGGVALPPAGWVATLHLRSLSWRLGWMVTVAIPQICLQGWMGGVAGLGWGWGRGGGEDDTWTLFTIPISQFSRPIEGTDTLFLPLPHSCVLFTLRAPPKGRPWLRLPAFRGLTLYRNYSIFRLLVWQLLVLEDGGHHRPPSPVQQPLESAQSLGS